MNEKIFRKSRYDVVLSMSMLKECQLVDLSHISTSCSLETEISWGVANTPSFIFLHVFSSSTLPTLIAFSSESAASDVLTLNLKPCRSLRSYAHAAADSTDPEVAAMAAATESQAE